MTRKDYLTLSTALRSSKALLLPDATTPRQAADLMHRACAEAVCAALSEASGFDEARFLADAGVRPACILVNFNGAAPILQDRSRNALPFDPPDAPT